CKVMAQEFREIFSAAIDVAGTPEEAAAAVVAELSAAPKEPVVAWRGGVRHVQRYGTQRIEGGSAPRLKPSGAYRIPGGLGGIGLKVAAWLARTAQGRLILLNRSPLPPRAEWESWLEKPGADERTSRRIRAVQELEAAGAQVLVL